MKITNEMLRQIIKEEVQKILTEENIDEVLPLGRVARMAGKALSQRKPTKRSFAPAAPAAASKQKEQLKQIAAQLEQIADLLNRL